MKSATPKKIYVTKMKFILLIKFMTIHKLLELQNYTESLAVRFWYGVKPPCAISVVEWNQRGFGYVPVEYLYAQFCV